MLTHAPFTSVLIRQNTPRHRMHCAWSEEIWREKGDQRSMISHKEVRILSMALWLSLHCITKKANTSNSQKLPGILGQLLLNRFCTPLKDPGWQWGYSAKMTRPMNREGRKAIVPTHYPSICHVLQFKFIAMSGMPIFIRETCYIPYLLKSGGQYANLVPSCINAMCITRPKWTDGRYRYCVSEVMPKSDESVVSE